MGEEPLHPEGRAPGWNGVSSGVTTDNDVVTIAPKVGVEVFGPLVEEYEAPENVRRPAVYEQRRRLVGRRRVARQEAGPPAEDGGCGQVVRALDKQVGAPEASGGEAGRRHASIIDIVLRVEASHQVIGIAMMLIVQDRKERCEHEVSR